MEYVPLWTDIIEGPCWKILDLPPEVYRFWTLCMLAAQKYDYVDGHLPDDRTLSAWIQMPRDMIVTLRDMAVTCHVLDDLGGGSYKIHDWEHWRDVKDKGATRRKRKQRKTEKGLTNTQEHMSRDGHGDVTGESRGGHALTLNSQLSTLKKSVCEEGHVTESTNGPLTALLPEHTHTLLESVTGRTGEEHTLFLRACDDLKSYPPTQNLAVELESVAGTPEIREIASWRIWTAARTIQQPDKSKDWPLFRHIAITCTKAQYRKFKSSANQNTKPAPVEYHRATPPAPNGDSLKPPDLNGKPSSAQATIDELMSKPRLTSIEKTLLALARQELAGKGTTDVPVA